LDEQPVETTLYSLTEAAPAPPERRREERQMSLLRVGLMMIGEQRELCLIRNVSSAGMMIRAYCPLAVGTRVSIELKHGHPVEGTVSWTKDESAGVEFDPPIDILNLLAASMNGARPRMPRIEIDCTAWVREGAVVHRTKAFNISQGGLRIECLKPLAIGAEVNVTIDGLTPIAGVVRWQDGNSYGLTFNRIITVPVLMDWLHARREASRAA
jgi:hypothetical protein